MGTSRRFDQQTASTIRTKYESGDSLNKLATEYDVAPYTIERAVIESGGSVRITSVGRGAMSDVQQKRAAQLYIDGLTVSQIKKKLRLKVAEQTIQSAIRRSGISLRKSGPQRSVEAYVTTEGYRRVIIDREDTFFEMGSIRGKREHDRTRTVLEHRLVLARKLGRALLPHETVHHKDGDRLNNHPDNLELRVGRHGKGATDAHCATCTCFHKH